MTMPLRSKIRRIAAVLLAAILLFLLLAYGALWWLFATASVSTHGDRDPGAGNIEVPSKRSGAASDQSLLTQGLVESWAQRDLEDWQQEGKVKMPRVLTARLAMGRDVEAVNEYLLAAHVRGTVGSVGPFHPGGDYDFTLAGLCLLLYSFGDSPDLLYPETVDHIVNVLMTEDGGTPIVYTPKLLGLPLRDTENHILMTEGARYLKNRWLRLHGDTSPRYNNETNGLEGFLLEYLSHMERAGFHEYNSRPYIGYTLTALLNLHSFAGGPVADAARRILDRANWEYAIGSLQFRRFPPFRRQPRRAVDTDLDGDYHTAMVKAWMSLRDSTTHQLEIRRGDHQALWVPFTSYRLPDRTARWIEEKPAEYFIRMGHGHDGSPEIYSGGPGFLITAGGVADDRFGQAVARPTTLMLNDGQLDLSALLQITGAGTDYRGWNNTGVYERFAVGHRVTVPESWQAVAEQGGLSVYRRGQLLIAVYADDGIGLFTLPDENDANQVVEKFMQRNGDPALLREQFTSIDGTVIRYDIDAPMDTWVIESVSGVNRDFGNWPLMAGRIGPDIPAQATGSR